MSDAMGVSFGDKLNRLAGNTGLPRDKAADKTEMDKDGFLKMFMEQIKHQDPFNPAKTEQFSQQLAMMSQLEQQVETNKNLEQMLAKQNNSQIAGLQLLGKEIVANKASVFKSPELPADILFTLPQKVEEMTIKIIDGRGEEIRSIDLGTHEAGRVQARWDGYTDTNMDVPSGRYAFKVEAKNIKGEIVNVETVVKGKVSGITNQDGETVLIVDGQRVGLNTIESISDPVNAATPSVEKAPEKGTETGVKVATNAKSDNNSVGTVNEGDSSESKRSADRLNQLLPLLYR